MELLLSAICLKPIILAGSLFYFDNGNLQADELPNFRGLEILKREKTQWTNAASFYKQFLKIQVG